jgi:hypothetical protein
MLNILFKWRFNLVQNNVQSWTWAVKAKYLKKRQSQCLHLLYVNVLGHSGMSSMRMTSLWPWPLMWRSNKLIFLYLFQAQFFVVCTSLILLKRYMLQYMKYQNIWIPTFVNILEDSPGLLFFKKYLTTVQF